MIDTKKSIRAVNKVRLHESLRSLEADMVDFYFYFKNEHDASRLWDILEGFGFEVACFERSRSKRNEWVLIVAKRILEDSLLPICEQFDVFAKQFNGVFDGYEREF